MVGSSAELLCQAVTENYPIAQAEAEAQREADTQRERNFGDMKKVPKEVRDKIWLYVLDLNSTLLDYCSGILDYPPIVHPKISFWWYRQAILCVNQAIYAEAREVMFSQNRFILSTTREPYTETSTKQLYSLELFVLKEDRTSDRGGDAFHQNYSEFCDQAYETNRIDMKAVDPDLLRKIRYLTVDLSDRHSLGRYHSVQNISITGTLYRQTLAIVNFIGRCNKLHSLQVDLNLGRNLGEFLEGPRTRIADHVLHNLGRLRGLGSDCHIDIRATCCMCYDSENHVHSALCGQDYALSKEQTEFLYKVARLPLNSVVSPFTDPRFSLIEIAEEEEGEEVVQPGRDKRTRLEEKWQAEWNSVANGRPSGHELCPLPWNSPWWYKYWYKYWT